VALADRGGQDEDAGWYRGGGQQAPGFCWQKALNLPAGACVPPDPEPALESSDGAAWPPPWLAGALPPPPPPPLEPPPEPVSSLLAEPSSLDPLSPEPVSPLPVSALPVSEDEAESSVVAVLAVGVLAAAPTSVFVD
jgi:hypothetical protein